MTLIASGKINSPVDYVDIELPTGYELFALRGVGWLADNSDLLSFRLSSDGGASFHAGPDGYRSNWTEHNGSVVFAGNGVDDQGYLAKNTSTQYDGVGGASDFYTGTTLSVLIDPGSDLRRPVVSIPMVVHEPATSSIYGSGVSIVVVQAPVRMNLIRIGPYFGDNVHLTRGCWWFEGLPTPP